jgi:hypothetical protein
VVKYDLYEVKLFLLQLVVETSSLWHCMFRSVVCIAVQIGSGPYSSAVSSIGASRIHLYRKFQSKHVCRGKPCDIKKTAGIPAQIRTRCLPDTSQVYHCSIFITIITIMECLLQWYLSFITFSN